MLTVSFLENSGCPFSFRESLEQRKLEIFLDGMQTWIVPWSGLLEGCCHIVVLWWSDVRLRWVKSILLLFGVV